MGGGNGVRPAEQWRIAILVGRGSDWCGVNFCSKKCFSTCLLFDHRVRYAMTLRYLDVGYRRYEYQA
eukprot:scaffold23928_cov54-Attheya_sp.AAC.7